MELNLTLAKDPYPVPWQYRADIQGVRLDHLDDELYLFRRMRKNPLLAISGKPALKTQ